jgi:hypothetical protein
MHSAAIFDMTVREETREATAMRNSGVDIEIYQSDNLQDLGTAGNNRACKEGRCAYYRKHCSAEGRVCEYAGGFDAAGVARFISGWSMKITAKSISALQRAQSALSLDIGKRADGTEIYLPLSVLNEESNSTNLFYCGANQSIRIQGCLTLQERRRIRFGQE